jgi:WD40 repeat protein
VQVYKSDTMRPSGEPIRTAEDVYTMVFSRDGRILATGGVSGTVELWDTDTGAPRGQPMTGDGQPVSSIAFSSDGQLLAAGDDDYTLRLWDTGTFKPVGNRMRLDSTPMAVAFSLDGRTLASGGNSGTIQLWDVGDQSKLGAPLTGHWNSVMSLYFSSNGKRLLSASLDGELREWPILPPTPDLLCAKLTRNMTRDQWNEWVSPEIKYRTVCPNLPEAE